MKNKAFGDEYKALPSDEAKIRYFYNNIKSVLCTGSTASIVQFERVVTESLKLYAAGKEAASLAGSGVDEFISFIAGEITLSLAITELTEKMNQSLAPLKTPASGPHAATLKVSTALPAHSNN